MEKWNVTKVLASEILKISHKTERNSEKSDWFLKRQMGTKYENNNTITKNLRKCINSELWYLTHNESQCKKNFHMCSVVLALLSTVKLDCSMLYKSIIPQLISNQHYLLSHFGKTLF